MTKNKYFYPIDLKMVSHINKENSLSHTRQEDPDTGYVYDFSFGIDYAAPIGTSVFASLEGTVHFIQDNVTALYQKNEFPSSEIIEPVDTLGNFVIIKHANKEFSWYAHLRHGHIPLTVGQKINKLGPIGIVDLNGWTLEPHLHFMVISFLNKENDLMQGFLSMDVNWAVPA